MTEAEIEFLIETALATPEDHPGRHAQIRSKLEDGDREDVAKFCAYHLQFDALGLKPHELAPCWAMAAPTRPMTDSSDA